MEIMKGLHDDINPRKKKENDKNLFFFYLFFLLLLPKPEKLTETVVKDRKKIVELIQCYCQIRRRKTSTSKVTVLFIYFGTKIPSNQKV